MILREYETTMSDAVVSWGFMAFNWHFTFDAIETGLYSYKAESLLNDIIRYSLHYYLNSYFLSHGYTGKILHAVPQWYNIDIDKINYALGRFSTWFTLRDMNGQIIIPLTRAKKSWSIWSIEHNSWMHPGDSFKDDHVKQLKLFFEQYESHLNVANTKDFWNIGKNLQSLKDLLFESKKDGNEDVIGIPFNPFEIETYRSAKLKHKELLGKLLETRVVDLETYKMYNEILILQDTMINLCKDKDDAYNK